MPQTIDDICEAFALLDDWEDRYRYVIELGRELPPYPEKARDAAHKVSGCVSQVWLQTQTDGARENPRLTFNGDSDAHIVKGLVAIVLALYSGKRAADIVALDAEALFHKLGLDENLTPQRANGLRSMVARIRHEAEAFL